MAAIAAPTGPPVPPHRHPLWQGSVSAHWVDPGSGFPRGKISAESHIRNGRDGVAMLGFGPFFTDVKGKLQEDRQQAKAFVADGPAERSPTYSWRPSIRTNVPALTVKEPERLSGRPPFVPRRGGNVCHWSASPLPPVYDADAEAWERSQVAAKRRDAYRLARAEDQAAKSMVLGLDEWERTHVVMQQPRPTRLQLLQRSNSGGRLSTAGTVGGLRFTASAPRLETRGSAIALHADTTALHTSHSTATLHGLQQQRVTFASFGNSGSSFAKRTYSKLSEDPKLEFGLRLG